MCRRRACRDPFLTVALLVTTTAAAQTQAPVTAPPGDPHEHVDTYPSGKVQRRYTVDDEGRRHGRTEEFTEEGARVLLAFYQHGARDGEWKEWLFDGRKIRALQWKADQLHGRCEEYHENGRVASSGEYRLGLRHGKWIESDRDGVRKVTAEYRQGRLHGTLRITIRDQPASKQSWRDGDLLQLDNLPPLPTPQLQLLTELRAIVDAAPKTLDPADALAADRQAALRRLAAYRRLCGLPFQDLVLVPDWNRRCDAAAETCRRLGRLDHHPPRPPDLDEARWQLGVDGAGHSNLASGGSLGSSVDQYMDDSDPSNIDRIGHRRWCLNPPLQKLGFGHDQGYSAMWSMDESGTAPRGLAAVCYPPHGYTPVDLFSAQRAFSVGLTKGSMPRKEDLVVTVQPLADDWLPRGSPLPLDWCAPAEGGFGSLPYLVFRPVGIEVEAGRHYLVSVARQGDKEPMLRYLVAFCAALTDGR